MRRKISREEYMRSGLLLWPESEEDRLALLFPEQIRHPERKERRVREYPSYQKFEVDQEDVFKVLVDILNKMGSGKEIRVT